MKVMAGALALVASATSAEAALFTASSGDIVFETTDARTDIWLQLFCDPGTNETRFFTADGTALCGDDRSEVILAPLTLYGVGGFAEFFGNPASSDFPGHIYAVPSPLDSLRFPGPIPTHFSCWGEQINGLPVCDTQFGWELFLVYLDEFGENFVEVTHLVQDFAPSPVETPLPAAAWLFTAGAMGLYFARRGRISHV